MNSTVNYLTLNRFEFYFIDKIMKWHESNNSQFDQIQEKLTKIFKYVVHALIFIGLFLKPNQKRIQAWMI